MKFGFNFSSFHPSTPLQEVFQQIRDVGFTGYEAALTDEGIVGLSGNESDFQNAKELSRAYGIEICSVLYAGSRYRGKLSDNDPIKRQYAFDTLRRLIDRAAELGAKSVLTFAGVVGREDITPAEEIVPYETAYQRAMDGMLRIKEYAEQAGISIAVENWWVKFLLSPLEFRDFLDKVNSPFVRACLDVGNAIPFGYPEDWIRILGKQRIATVHVKDYRYYPGGRNSYVDLLSGDVNFPAVEQALREIGFDGYCLAETTPYKYYNEQQIKNTAASIKTIFFQNQK